MWKPALATAASSLVRFHSVLRAGGVGWQRRLCSLARQHQHKRVPEQPVLCGPGQLAAAPGRLQPSPPHAVTFSKRVSVSYSPPVNPLVSHQVDGLVYWMSGSKAGLPNMWFLRSLHPSGTLPEPAIPLLVWVTYQCVSPSQMASPLFLPDSVWIFSYSCDFRRVIL